MISACLSNSFSATNCCFAPIPICNYSISGFRHIRTATEAAIVGWLATHYKKELFIVSDEAGQFRVFRHGLCWIHTERKLSSLIPSSDEQVKLQEQALDHFWQFYRILKQYKASPNYRRKKHLKYLFSKLFIHETRWPDLNKALELIHGNAKELLM